MPPFLRIFTFLALLSSPLTAQRTGDQLVALYKFNSDSGKLIKNQAPSGSSLDLTITKPDTVKRGPGRLIILGPTQLVSQKPAKTLTEAVKRSGELTIEAWITPANANQKGPARIVSLSNGSTNRNFTLGQEGAKFDVRFRSSKTDKNGLPSLSGPDHSLATKRTHLLFSRDRTGQARLYLNGRQVAQRQVTGNTRNWDSNFKLTLGDEFGGQRPWLGSYHLIALYSRALNPTEVSQNYKAGPDGTSASPAELSSAKNITRFETEIAPLLAKHCLECHDASKKKGKLNLSQRDTALAGGKHGRAVVAGNLEKSLLWESVESDEMPRKR